MRTRFTIPTRGSPGCVLAVTSLLLGLFGILLILVGLSAAIADGTQFDNLLPLATGVLLSAIAIPAGISGFKKSESPQSLLSSDMNPLERVSNTTDQVEIELANKEIAEATRIALQLAPSDHQLLKTIRTTAVSASSHDEVVRTLAAQASTEIQLANPRLQPIAFALKPTTGWNYVKGVLLEAVTWALVILASPLIIVSDVWTVGRIVVHRALRLRRLARQYRGRSNKLLRHDDRMPVLYLRSFSHDDRESSETFLPTTSEEKLVRSYNRVGPVIALGNPRERLPILGASRLYIDDDSTWQPVVLYLMSVSQLVVIQAGNALGLLQELGFARWRLDPGKVIISFSAWGDLDEWTRQLQYLRFKKFAEALLDCKLPEDIKATSHLTFDEGWEPRPQSDLSYSIPSVRKKRARLKRIAVGVLATVSIFWALYIGPWALTKIIDLTGVNRYREIAARWKVYPLGSTGMSVELPGDPVSVDRLISFSFGLQEHSTYIYDSGDLISTMHYERYSRKVALDESGLRSAAANLCGVDAVTDFAKQPLDFGKSRWDGKCLRNGKEYKLSGYSFKKSQSVWLILALYDPSNNAASLAAEKMFNSVKIAGFDTYKENAAHWKVYLLGSTGMSVELPADPTRVDERPIESGLLDYSGFEYDGGNLLALMQNERYFWNASVSEIGLRGLATNLCGVDALSELATQQIADGKFGLNGKCSRNREEYKLRGYCFTKDENFWVILALYDSSDNAATLAVDRMLNSVRIAE